MRFDGDGCCIARVRLLLKDAVRSNSPNYDSPLASAGNISIARWTARRSLHRAKQIFATEQVHAVAIRPAFCVELFLG